jgi:voltage-gated potassium channel
MQRVHEQLDRWTPGPMFATTLLFLVAVGAVVPFGIDDAHIVGVDAWRWVLVVLYPVFLAELIVHLAVRSPRWKQQVVFCLVPPLRLAARDTVTGRRIWLPGRGWLRVDERLAEEVARRFSVPMIVIALAMVPLLALEFVQEQMIRDNAAIEAVVHYGTAVIWTAFTVEFIVMIAIVKRRFRYCKEHWVDLVIILAPFLAFARLLRLSRLVRLQTLLRSARVYRLRGLAMRAYRALFLLGLLRRLFPGKPKRRLARLEEQLAEKQAEARALESEIAKLRVDIARAAPASASTAQETTSPSRRQDQDVRTRADDHTEPDAGGPHGRSFQQQSQEGTAGP